MIQLNPAPAEETIASSGLQRFGTTAELLLSIPERLVAALQVPLGAVVAVFGAGPDVFASALSDRVGSRGLVYSLELSDEVVVDATSQPQAAYVKMRHEEHGHLPFPDQSLDVALWAFAFGSLGHVASMLTETHRILRPDGRIAVVDWIRQEETSGPRRDDRVSAATCERCLAASGFGVIGQRALNHSHYVIVGRRQSAGTGNVPPTRKLSRGNAYASRPK